VRYSTHEDTVLLNITEILLYDNKNSMVYIIRYTRLGQATC